MAEGPKDVQDINKNPEEPQSPEKPESEEREVLSVEQLSQKIKELQDALTKEKEDKDGIIEQLKEVRIRKQEEEVKNLAPQAPEVPADDEVESKVKSVLKKERDTLARENRVTALHKFWEKHPEFSSDNDISGLKMEAVHQTLKKLNTSSSYTVEDILANYEDALKLMRKEKEPQPAPNLNQLASQSAVPTSVAETEEGQLTPEQEKLRKERGWTVKKYLEMKAKHPKIIS